MLVHVDNLEAKAKRKGNIKLVKAFQGFYTSLNFALYADDKGFYVVKHESEFVETISFNVLAKHFGHRIEYYNNALDFAKDTILKSLKGFNKNELPLINELQSMAKKNNYQASVARIAIMLGVVNQSYAALLSEQIGE